MTNHWVDFKNSDVMLVIGANPAENHPCGWKWAHVARDTRGAKIIHVDPRFTRTSAVADIWAPIRAGTDVTFFGGLINHVLQNNLFHEEYVKLHTNASFILDQSFEFNDGLFSGYDPEARVYNTATWDYERIEGTGAEAQVQGKEPAIAAGFGLQPTPKGEQPAEERSPAAVPGFAKRDMTLQNPRTVFQLLKRHYSRYTPEMVSEVTGIPEEKFLQIAEIFGASGAPDKAGNVIYAVGLTHHTTGTQMIRGIAILQLLLGNVGKPGGGVNAERGHANIQGNTDNAQSWEILPGYMAVPKPGMNTLDDYVNTAALAQLDANSMNFFGSMYRAFTVSLLKAFFGDKANDKNDFAFSWLPKPDKNWGWLTFHDEARSKRLHGIFNSGMSSVNIGADSNRMIESLSNLRWFVIMDPLPTASSEFWRAPGVDPTQVDTEMFFFPTTHWIEKSGAFTNSGRWVQWKHAALPKEGDIKDDNEILAALFFRLKDLYEKEGGAFPDPILNLDWPYSDPDNPGLEELSKEMNGKDLKTGLQLSTFLDAKEDGTTAIGNWIYTGSFTEEGNMMDRRGTDDPTGMGFFHNWTWSWPANRRVLYNRASADAKGNPWPGDDRVGIRWNGELWVGDVPDFSPDSPPKEGVGAFIMTGEGVGRLFAPGGLLLDGPIPEHYEQTESPIDNPFSRQNKSPVAILYEDAPASFAEDDREFPYVATTYRVTEHEHYVTQHVPFLVESMPDFFIEMSPELAAKKGISNTDLVRVRSKRGQVEAIALVTKRMRPLRLGRKVVHQIGIPVHWHYAAGKSKGKPHQMANLLTPYIGDGTTATPEFKGFLVDIEKI